MARKRKPKAHEEMRRLLFTVADQLADQAEALRCLYQTAYLLTRPASASTIMAITSGMYDEQCGMIKRG